MENYPESNTKFPEMLHYEIQNVIQGLGHFNNGPSIKICPGILSSIPIHNKFQNFNVTNDLKQHLKSQPCISTIGSEKLKSLTALNKISKISKVSPDHQGNNVTKVL